MSSTRTRRRGRRLNPQERARLYGRKLGYSAERVAELFGLELIEARPIKNRARMHGKKRERWEHETGRLWLDCKSNNSNGWPK